MTEKFKYYFEWDSVKAASNQHKHGINFELAATVFNDPLMLSIPDKEHSEAEERWLTLGQTENSKLLVVIHTYQSIGGQAAKVRIISARTATQHERRDYEAGL